MSEHTIQADEAIHAAQEATKAIALSDIRATAIHLASALSYLTAAVERIEGQLSDLQNATGEDPGIQIHDLKDTVRGLESRIENLERRE